MVDVTNNLNVNSKSSDENKSFVYSINDQNFDDVVLNEKTLLTLVDFWAPWCGPCRAIAPILEEIGLAFKDRVKIFKMNIDDDPNVPVKYQVRSIPTLILFFQGEKLESKVGMQSKDSLDEWLQSHIAQIFSS